MTNPLTTCSSSMDLLPKNTRKMGVSLQAQHQNLVKVSSTHRKMDMRTTGGRVHIKLMGPLQDSDHMVQIRHTGTQIAHWDI